MDDCSVFATLSLHKNGHKLEWFGGWITSGSKRKEVLLHAVFKRYESGESMYYLKFENNKKPNRLVAKLDDKLKKCCFSMKVVQIMAWYNKMRS